MPTVAVAVAVALAVALVAAQMIAAVAQAIVKYYKYELMQLTQMLLLLCIRFATLCIPVYLF
jgi:hypothetical protein